MSYQEPVKKQSLLVAASVIVAFCGVSCEKHSWEDTVEVKEEKIYDEDGNVVQVVKTELVAEKGAKRFFMEEKKH